MTIKQLISRFESEAEEIKAKMAALEQRAETVQMMLKELRSETKGKPGRPAKKATAVKSTAKRPGRKKKGGMTVRDAIVQTVMEASEALTAKDIIDGAAKLSGGAIASIRTQINTLSRAGFIKQVPYEGRGFRYGKPTAKKAVAKKSVAKKK